MASSLSADRHSLASRVIAVAALLGLFILALAHIRKAPTSQLSSVARASGPISGKEQQSAQQPPEDGGIPLRGKQAFPRSLGDLTSDIELVMAQTHQQLAALSAPESAIREILEWNSSPPEAWSDRVQRAYGLAYLPMLVPAVGGQSDAALLMLKKALRDPSDTFRQAFAIVALYGVEGEIRFDRTEDHAVAVVSIGPKAEVLPSIHPKSIGPLAVRGSSADREFAEGVESVFRTTPDIFLKEIALAALAMLGTDRLVHALRGYDFGGDLDSIGPLYRMLAEVGSQEAIAILQDEESNAIQEGSYPVPYVSRLLASLGHVNEKVMIRACDLLEDSTANSGDLFKAADYIASAMASPGGEKFRSVSAEHVASHSNPWVVGRLVDGLIVVRAVEFVPSLHRMLDTIPDGYRRDSIIFALEALDDGYEGPRSYRGLLKRLKAERDNEGGAVGRSSRIADVTQTLNRLVQQDLNRR